MSDTADLSPEAVLSDAELRAYYRAHPRRGSSCSNGKCGGCPACLAAQGIAEDEESACA